MPARAAPAGRQKAATWHPKLGTDTAHARDIKKLSSGCAGIYTAHAARAPAEAFEAAGDLDSLEGSRATSGRLHGLRNKERITLEKRDWVVPGEYPFGDETVVPLRAGEKVAWKLAANP